MPAATNQEALPSHASPRLSAQEHPHDTPSSTTSKPHHTDVADYLLHSQPSATGTSTPGLPETLVSPAFTPPSTPGGATTPSTTLREPRSIPVDSTTDTRRPPHLLEKLPHVECIVRARIPTTSGAEMFLHLYTNDADNKEHLAIVFGNTIRSRSLDRVIPGETEMDRMIRGAYVGRLFPGRTSSRETPVGGSSASAAAAESTTNSKDFPLVRIHSECYTGETAWSARCDCGEQLDEAARLMSLPSNVEGAGGVIVYLRQEGRGIGLGEKLKAYNLQDLGNDTVEANLLLRHPADARSYGLATAMLCDLGLGECKASQDGQEESAAQEKPLGIRLLTNNPDKVRAVEGPNREVVVRERVPMVPIAWKTGGQRGVQGVELNGYLRTKVRLSCDIHKTGSLANGHLDRSYGSYARGAEMK